MDECEGDLGQENLQAGDMADLFPQGEAGKLSGNLFLLNCDFVPLGKSLCITQGFSFSSVQTTQNYCGQIPNFFNFHFLTFRMKMNQRTDFLGLLSWSGGIENTWRVGGCSYTIAPACLGNSLS